MFDSGVGGLTVVREIMRQIPQERIVYFGDTARVPYGNKSKDNIIRYSRQIIRFLRTQKVKAIVVACNTASACALEEIRPELDLPIIGVIKPGAKVAANTTSCLLYTSWTERDRCSFSFGLFFHCFSLRLLPRLSLISWRYGMILEFRSISSTVLEIIRLSLIHI